MSPKVIWRSGVFVITIILIYFAFPILIVPSSLPAINQMFVENTLPESTSPSNNFIANHDSSDDPEIYQLNVPTVPTLQDKIKVLKSIHQQGLNKIFSLEGK